MTLLPAATIFRDYEIDGVPSSGPHAPIKADIRAWGASLDGVSAATIFASAYGVAVGVSDIGPSVNAAIAAAALAGYPEIVLPAGTLTLKSPVYLNRWAPSGVLTVPGLKLRGAGREVTIIDTQLANNHAIQVNPEWRRAFKALAGITTGSGGALGSGGAIAALGSITPGSGYTNGTYSGVALTGGSGAGATANITVAGGIVTAVTLVGTGTGSPPAYAAGDTLGCASIGGGSGFSIPVASITYHVQITVNEPLGNEIFVTLPKSIAVGASGQIAVILPALNTGYSYNLYCDTNTQPAHYGIVASTNAIGLSGGSTVQITAVGSTHTVPTTNFSVWQEAAISDLSITNATAAANASGVLLFKCGYTSVRNVYFSGLTEDGVTVPDYTGDVDGSFYVTFDNCKFDGCLGWGINAAGAALELSNFTVDRCAFNLCGTLPANIGTAVTISAIPNSSTPSVTTSTPHNLKSGDQIAFSVAGITLASPYYRVGSTVTTNGFNLVDLNGNAVNTTSLGAFSSGTVSLSWRPPVWDPVNLKTAGSGGIAWLGLIGSLTNSDFTQCKNVNFYASEVGSSDNLHIADVDCENTYGKGYYLASLSGGSLIGGEILSTTASGPTISGVQLGTGMAAGGVRGLTISSIKVRSDVTPCTAFEQFQNTNIGASFADNNRVFGETITWQAFDAAGQTRFDGFKFAPITGQAQFSISALNTASLGSSGFGACIPLKLAKTGEWVACHVGTGLARAGLGGLTASTQYYFYAQNSAANLSPITASILAPSTTAPAIDSEGYYTLPTDSTQTYIGTATTDGSGNFQATGSQASQYPALPANIKASAQLGYAPGAGGTVTQATNRTTGVTLNKSSGAITTNNTSLAAGATARFTVTNSQVAATDTVSLSIKSGATTDQTDVKIGAVAAGSFDIIVANRHASTAETGAIVINFNLIKGVTA